MKSQHKCVVVFALVCCCALLMALIFSAVDVWGDDEDGVTLDSCSTACRVELLENPPGGLGVAAGLSRLLEEARRTVEIVSPLWDLNSSAQAHLPQTRAAQVLLGQLMSLRSRSVSLKLVSALSDSSELRALAHSGAEVHHLNMKALTKGTLNSSFWIVDRRHMYMGSAGMDWRSLTTHRALGLVLYDCSCLALDLQRLFSLYRQLHNREFVPSVWSKKLSALFTRERSLRLRLNGTPADAFISSSPDVFCPKDRTKDLDAIKRVIHEAETFIYISMTDYLPVINRSRLRYWAGVDGVLREALLLKRRLRVCVLLSCQERIHALTLNFLWSLKALCVQTLNCSVDAKVFLQRDGCETPSGRFMVTDSSLYVGSVDFVGGGVAWTAGAGLVLRQRVENGTGVVQHMKAVFERDWSSAHSHSLRPRHSPACGDAQT